MAEEQASRPVATGLEDILASEEDKAAEELRRLRAGEQTSETPVEGLPTEPEAAAPTPPGESAAPSPAPEPPPAPVAADRPPQQSGEGWKQARINERRAKEAEERAAHFERLAREFEAKQRGERIAESRRTGLQHGPREQPATSGGNRRTGEWRG